MADCVDRESPLSAQRPGSAPVSDASEGVKARRPEWTLMLAQQHTSPTAQPRRQRKR